MRQREIKEDVARAERHGGGVSAWRSALAGLCASLVGLGLARFSYTPLIPALIAGEWFTPSGAAYLGAANFAGYLAGALLNRRIAAHAPAATVLRAMMALATAAFFACAWPWSFWWFFVWRFAAGLAGGVLMVLAPSAVLPQVPPSVRGLVGGVIFTGVGLGIAASGTLVPFLLRFGLVQTWCGLGTLALALTALAWRGWPDEPARPASTLQGVSRWRSNTLPALWPLYLEYGLVAVGFVPHMVFLVDFIARGLGQGIDVGSRYWVLFGLSAMVGPVLAGYLADRIGFGPALRLALGGHAAAVALLAVTDSLPTLVVSSMIVGALAPGLPLLVLARVHELLPRNARGQEAGWSRATATFALGQAGAAYGFSFLYAHTGSYPLLFELAAGAVVLALTIDLATAVLTRVMPERP